jgi:DNA-binding LacI/PurR family transcriptional regulator
MRRTSADVAREAGVSRATVSYVLNNTPSQTISPGTRAAVLDAARRLGYQPHPGARALRMGRGDAVLFPLPGVAMTYVFAEVIDACSAALIARGLTLVTDFTRYPTPKAQAEAWLRLYPAAVIDLTLRRDDPALERLRQAGVPLVSAAVEGQPDHMSAQDVISDRARQKQISYLISRGYRKLAFAIPSGDRLAHFDRRRQTAYERFAQEAGGALTFRDVELERQSMYDAVTEWGDGNSPPDAICAYNDELAIGLLGVLSEAGVRVPQDLAVIGVDDLPLASIVSPTLTTVTWTVQELGESLAATTTALLDDGAASLRFAVPEMRVIERGSA